jgi:putative tricarboxylic transport membrane protein
MAGAMGSLIGTITLAFCIPLAQPLIHLMGAPEMAVFIIWGLTMIGVLAGREPLKGVIAALIGLLLSTVGQQAESGIMRFVFEQIYLLDGFDTSIVALSLFGIPAALTLAVNKVGIEQQSAPLKGRMSDGIRDALREWWLVVRCSFVGIWVGLVPGVGSQTVDWLAYGHASQTCKGAKDTFGKGDVRGVIAAECANDAKDGGDLMSVLLLGIPQGATTALFIVALLAWGIVPGPEMVKKHFDLIFSIIWIQGIAGIIGTLLGFLLANQLAKLAQVRYSLLVPLILMFVFLGGFSTRYEPLDLLTVVSFGIFGYLLLRLGYPRPALLLGFVLGPLLERYLFRSMATYGVTWLLHPPVVILLIITFITLFLTIRGRFRSESAETYQEHPRATQRFNLKFRSRALLPLFLCALFALAICVGFEWPFVGSLLPVYAVAIPGLFLAALQLWRELTRSETSQPESQVFQADETFTSVLDNKTVTRRTVVFFGWCGGIGAAIWLLGMTISMPLFVLLYTFIEGKERWYMSLGMSLVSVLLIQSVFGFLGVQWPPGILF